MKIIGDSIVTGTITSGKINIPQWQSSVDYISDDLFIGSGQLFKARSSFTSGAEVGQDLSNLSYIAPHTEVIKQVSHGFV